MGFMMSKEKPKLVYVVDTSKIVNKCMNEWKRNEYKFIDYKDYIEKFVEFEEKKVKNNII
jgi:hypothetical protein